MSSENADNMNPNRYINSKQINIINKKRNRLKWKETNYNNRSNLFYFDPSLLLKAKSG